MKKYISYLINDLQHGQQEAYASVIDSFNYSLPLREAVATEGTISQLTSIPTSAFPPAHKLDSMQLQAVVKEMKQVLQLLRIHVHFPQAFPLDRQYTLMVAFWGRTISLQGHKKQYIDFCAMETDQCPYGNDFCYCREYPEDWDDF